MFHPRLADLFEALGVICSAAHTIEILRNDRVIGLRQLKPIDRLITVVTGVCPYGQTNLCRVVSLLVHVFDVSDDHIRPGHQGRRVSPECMLQWRHHHRFGRAVHQLGNLDRLHRNSDGDFSATRASV